MGRFPGSKGKRIITGSSVLKKREPKISGGTRIKQTKPEVMPKPVYVASHIKRSRSTKAEIEARRKAFTAIIDAGRPMIVRQVFYQATVHGIVEKEETGYNKVQTDLVKMRKNGSLQYDWLVDNTRWQRSPQPSTAWKRLSGILPSSTGRACGLMLIAMLRFGWRRMHWLA